MSIKGVAFLSYTSALYALIDPARSVIGYTEIRRKVILGIEVSLSAELSAPIYDEGPTAAKVDFYFLTVLYNGVVFYHCPVDSERCLLFYRESGAVY